MLPYRAGANHFVVWPDDRQDKREGVIARDSVSPSLHRIWQKFDDHCHRGQ